MHWGMLALVVVSVAVLTSCGGGGHSGYMTRPCTVGGVRYHPLAVDEALGYRENGVGSW